MFKYGSLSRNSADEIILLMGMAPLSTPQYVAMYGQLAIISITSEIHKESCKTKEGGEDRKPPIRCQTKQLRNKQAHAFGGKPKGRSRADVDRQHSCLMESRLSVNKHLMLLLPR